jgi:hypothetical protein
MTIPAWLRPARSPAAPAGAALASTQLREEVIDALGVAFAQNDLTMEELEGRLALAFRTSDPAALRELLSDLPSAAAWREANVARAEPDAPVIPERGVLAAFMGGNVRKGSWAVPRYLKVVAVMGGVELDLRHAVLAPGLTEIEVFAVMGGVDIIVPPGVRVETMGMAVMGGFETSAGDAHATSPDRPFIRISGLAVMGGVEAAVRRPSAKAMKKFRRAVERARKQGA